MISAKRVAKLRKEALLAGESWEFDEPKKEAKRRKPKGHKHDRLKADRYDAVAPYPAYMARFISSRLLLMLYRATARSKEENSLLSVLCKSELFLSPCVLAPISISKHFHSLCRDKTIAENLAKMDEMIAESRRKRRELKAPVIDRLLLSASELRRKHRSS